MNNEHETKAYEVVRISTLAPPPQLHPPIAQEGPLEGRCPPASPSLLERTAPPELSWSKGTSKVSPEREPVQGALSALPEQTRISKALGGRVPSSSSRAGPGPPRLSLPANPLPSPAPSRDAARPGRSAGRAPSRTLQVQGWNQRLPAPPACGPRGSVVSAPRSRPCLPRSRAGPPRAVPPQRPRSRQRRTASSRPPRDSLAAGPRLCAPPGRPGSRSLREPRVRTTNAPRGSAGRGRSRRPAQPGSGSLPRGLGPAGRTGQRLPVPSPLPAARPRLLRCPLPRQSPTGAKDGEGRLSPAATPPHRRLTPSGEVCKRPQGCPWDPGASRPTPICRRESTRTPSTRPRAAGPPRGGRPGPPAPPHPLPAPPPPPTPAAEGAGRARSTYPGARVRTWVARR